LSETLSNWWSGTGYTAFKQLLKPYNHLKMQYLSNAVECQGKGEMLSKAQSPKSKVDFYRKVWVLDDGSGIENICNCYHF
jgi:hypothetical protein